MSVLNFRRTFIKYINANEKKFRLATDGRGDILRTRNLRSNNYFSIYD
jgi:hypothetical protein